MSKEIYISSTPHETRLAIVEHDELTEIYYERENEYTLAGSIYNGKVTRVLPGMQSSFVDIGLERDAFLYTRSIHCPPQRPQSRLAAWRSRRGRRDTGECIFRRRFFPFCHSVPRRRLRRRPIDGPKRPR